MTDRDKATNTSPPLHKGKNGDPCECGIVFDHNTVPSPHRDRLERPCGGEIRAHPDRPEERVCMWCGRRERYHPRELTIIFHRSEPPVTMHSFLTEFILKGCKLNINREAVDKTGMTAFFVFIPEKGPSPDEWTGAFEQSRPVRAAIKTLLISFGGETRESALPPATQKKKAKENDEGDVTIRA